MLGHSALGAVALGGTQAGTDRFIAAEVGSFAWTGYDAVLTRRVLSADAGAFAWTGYDAGGQYARAVVCETGSFVWTWHDADQVRTRRRIRAHAGSSNAPGLSASSGGGARLTMRTTRAC